MEKIGVFYLEGCPIDRSGIYFDEILEKGMCEKDFKRLNKSLYQLKDEEVNENLLLNFKDDYLLLQKLKEFRNFFYQNTGHQPLKLQIYLAKRLLRKESFSIIAPTGIGKTTFGIVMAHFYPGKVYYLVPSKILLRELERKLSNIKSNKKILVIKEKEDKEILAKGDFDILLTTSNFLHKNFDIIPKNFDLVFVDDADSLIRQPRNIDKILELIKFTDEEIEKALKIIDQKRKAKNKEDFQKVDNLEIDLKNKGVVVAASATLTPKTKRIALFRELLGFEIGSATTFLRNVEEVYEKVEKEKIFERSIDWIKKFGYGGFVFLSDDYSKEDLENYVEFLNQNNISAISYEKFNTKNKEKFLKDEIQVVVGFSNIRNPLTRGIDLPQKVRYALFLGVPKFRINLKVSYSPLHLFLLGLSLREVLDEEKFQIEKRLNFLKKISFLKEEQVLADENLKDKIEPIKREFEEILINQEILEKIGNHPSLRLEKENDNYYLIVSDPRGYLQASGRTSRLYPFGLTQGLAFVLVENLKTLKHLEEKLKILGYETKFKNFTDVDLEKIFKKIDKDREIVKKVLEGKEFTFQDPIETALLIVESPTKAKTIANFFGKPAKRIKNNIIFYEVSMGNLQLNICATLGHFVDLIHQKGIYGVDKENSHFVPIFQPLKICLQCEHHLDVDEKECPVCHSTKFLTKEELIQNLQKIALEVDKIYLTTDPDTEGEKIAFDLLAYLYSFNQNIYRIELHEITLKEFLRRIKEPRKIDFNLVKAQLLRRISDRWIGFKLSEEIQNHFKNLNLSAGRVQTPVLGWILEKEKRIKEEKHYLIVVELNGKNISFVTENKEIVEKLKEKFKEKNLEIEIKVLEEKEEIINPLPPYETSSLLKDASNFFKFGADFTMKLAQNLFEQGLITYHRTDSIFISEFGRNLAEEYLEKKNLKSLIYRRGWGEIGTHEGIRPTKALDVQDLIEKMILEQRNLTKNHLQLYGLIFNRFLSSQMKAAKVKKIDVEIKLAELKKKETFFTKVLKENCLKFFKNIRLNEIKPDKFLVENLKIRKISKEFHYLQGEIIDEMKKKNLGRPSTYSNIIETLLERKYVLNRSGYLIPTNLGKEIYKYLIEKHQDLVSEEFTIKLEKEMDLVAEGKKNYQKILLKTYQRVFENEYQNF